MGSDCRIVARADAGIVAAARDLISALESRWSRFLPDSEISRVNRAAGALCVVSEPTFRLVELAERARALTRGRFNPLMATQLSDLGYDRPWDRGVGPTRVGGRSPASPDPIALFAEVRGVRLPRHCHFDPGGIGKGLAADLAHDSLIARGATTVMVELGGDLRVGGDPWHGPEWLVDVEHPFDTATDLARFTMGGGAVTTSSILRRRWHTDDGDAHHLLDPDTGEPADTDLVAVTASGSEAWWSEVVSKTALIGGSACLLDTLDRLETPGVAVTVDGRVIAAQGVAA